MLAFGTVVFILTASRAVLSQDAPPQCRGPPPGVHPAECCKIPPFFSEDDFSGCGIKKPSENDEPFKHGPPDCSKQVCLLKKYNLMKDDTNIDKDAASSFVDEWAKKNSDFKDAAAAVKDKCLKGDLPGPPHICEPDRLMFCSIHVMHANCPNWENNENCKKLKDHIEECKAYLP